MAAFQWYCAAICLGVFKSHNFKVVSLAAEGECCIKAHPCPNVGFLPPSNGAAPHSSLGLPSPTTASSFLVCVCAGRFVEGDGITGKTVPFCSTTHAYIMCLSFASDTGCAYAGVIHPLLCSIYQQFSDNNHVIFQVNLHLPIRKFILDWIFLLVCTNRVRESGWGEKAQ